MNRKFLNVPYYMWGLFVVSSFIFIFFPQIDLYISSLFYDGGHFYIRGTLFEQILYHSVRPIIIFIALSSLFIFIYNIFKKKSIFNLNTKTILYILLVLALAPGLIVNVVLKENWERARPSQTKNFGGDKEFTPAFIPTDQGGYSFSSGHAAAAFSLLGIALLARKNRKLWITLAITYGASVSLVRVLAGSHFFSDVISSFFIVYILTYILYDKLIKEST